MFAFINQHVKIVKTNNHTFRTVSESCPFLSPNHVLFPKHSWRTRRHPPRLHTHQNDWLKILKASGGLNHQRFNLRKSLDQERSGRHKFNKHLFPSGHNLVLLKHKSKQLFESPKLEEKVQQISKQWSTKNQCSSCASCSMAFDGQNCGEKLILTEKNLENHVMLFQKTTQPKTCKNHVKLRCNGSASLRPTGPLFIHQPICQ